MDMKDVLKMLRESPGHKEREQEKMRFLEMIEADKRALHEDPRRFSDRGLMERIDGLANVRSSTPFDDEYSVSIEPLSFSGRTFEEDDPQTLRTAWGTF